MGKKGKKGKKGKRNCKNKQKTSVAPVPAPKTKLERLMIVQETENKLIEHRIEHEVSSKVLIAILNDYLINGTVYINKELSLSLRADIKRKYVINLYNDNNYTDQVLIRAVNVNVNEES